MTSIETFSDDASSLKWIATILLTAGPSVFLVLYCCKRGIGWRCATLRCVIGLKKIFWVCGWRLRRQPWEDPAVFADKKLPAHTPLRYFVDEKDALAQNLSPHVLDLGLRRWRFRLFPTPEAARAETKVRELSFDDREWAEVPVPSNWQLLGFAAPCYTNIAYPFTAAPLLTAPSTPRSNPTGVYRTLFDVPVDWRRGRRVHLSFQAVGPAVLVWVDGQYVGYSQDSMTPAEFDITTALRKVPDTVSAARSEAASPSAALLADQHLQEETKDHVLVAMVPTWCDGSYMEDQDQWWLTGMHRTVQLYSVPEPLAIRDYEINAAWRPMEEQGILTVTTFLSAPAVARSNRLRFKLLSPKAAGAQILIAHTADLTDGEVALQGPVMELNNVSPWSAEVPTLYTLVLELLDDAGTVVQVERAEVGFRSVDIFDGQLRVNGVPLVVAGANVHEMHPRRGKAITEQDMLDDIVMLKRGNFNAVRNSHYPHHARWYELCDQHGLYVVEEANIETHGFVGNLAISILACDEAWAPQYLHRAKNMFHRAKNHACVIVWSLGNESGWGPNFQACVDWIREADSQRRPVQYEGAEHHGDAVFFFGDGQGPSSDIICPMYWSPTMILPLNDGGAAKNVVGERPVILCEYTHALGNSNGSLRSYWDLFWSTAAEHKRLQGGFVWEWADGALERVPRTPRTGSTEEALDGDLFQEGNFGYGGDFGPESGKEDAHFIVDGILFPDRTPHPGYLECKRLQQPVALKLLDPGAEMSEGSRRVSVEVENRYRFRSLSHLEVWWCAVDAGGGKPRFRSEAGVQLPDISAGTRHTLELKVGFPSKALRECGQWLHVELRLRADEAPADAVLAPAGFVVAEAGFTLLPPSTLSSAATASGGEQLCAGSAAPLQQPTAPPSIAVQRSHGGEEDAIITAPNYVARVCGGRVGGRAVHGLASLRVAGENGRELLATGGQDEPAIRQCFYRAPTDNDRCGIEFFLPWTMKVPFLPGLLRSSGNLSLAAVWRMAGLDLLEAFVVSHKWEQENERPCLLTIEEFRSPRKAGGKTCFRSEVKYTFGPEDVLLEVNIVALGPVITMPTVPRVGIELAAAPSLSRLTWLGCGPGESYPDRKAATDWSVHYGDVDSQHVDYIVPSENGGKADVHWAFLSDPADQTSSGLLMQYSCADEVPAEEQPGDGPSGSRPAGTRGAQLSVSRWTVGELMGASHRHQLPREPKASDRPIRVHLDSAHAGIGGAGEGGAKLWATAKQFLVDPRQSPWTYSVRLRPVLPNAWVHKGPASS